MAEMPQASLLRRCLAAFTPAEPVLDLKRRADLATIARLFVFSFAALVLWARAGVILHEAAGHALVWKVHGGSIDSIEVTLFGGGRVRTSGPAAHGAWLFVFSMAGIFLNAFVGAGLTGLTWWLLRRGQYAWAIAASWGAVVNLAGATHYAAIGAFYGYGDAGPYPWVWLPSFVLLLVTMPVGVFLWARSFVAVAARDAELDAAARLRPGLGALAVVVLSLAAYAAGLWGEQALSSQRTEFATLRAERVAIAREMARLREEKERQWRRLHGDEPAPEEFLAVSSDEIQRPFPFLALVLSLDAVLILAVLARGLRPPRASQAAGLSPVRLGVACASSLALLLACHLFF